MLELLLITIGNNTEWPVWTSVFITGEHSAVFTRMERLYYIDINEISDFLSLSCRGADIFMQPKYGYLNIETMNIGLLHAHFYNPLI